MTQDMQAWVEEYSLQLLRWANARTGSRAQAEELVQEIWLQFFSAARQEAKAGREVEQPGHLLWKVARYTWCRQLRKTVACRRMVPMDGFDAPDPTDFANDLAETEERQQQISAMRQCVVRLSRMQREIMIHFYIDGATQQQIAGQLGIRVSAVKWHLFDARRKLREEITAMTQQNFIYRPKHIRMALSGSLEGVSNPDTRAVGDSLIRQNICALCYRQGQTAESLTKQLGIPGAYIDYDLEWLVRKEFLQEKNGRYFTTFLIRSGQQEQSEFAVYLKHAADLCDALADGLMAMEAKIRSIGFVGCDRPMDRLLWLLIYRWSSYALSRSCALPEVQPPIRPDGGRYFPLGFDDAQMDPADMVLDRSDWAANGVMSSGGFRWYGLYNFGQSEIDDLLCGFTPGWERLHMRLVKILAGDHAADGLDEAGREELAQLVQKGYFRMEGGKAVPNFCVFTAQQYGQLTDRVFEPLRQRLDGALKRFAQDMSDHCADALPDHLKHLQPVRLRLELGDLGFISTMLAFGRGLLYVPKDEADGEFLTLMYLSEK